MLRKMVKKRQSVSAGMLGAISARNCSALSSINLHPPRDSWAGVAGLWSY